MTPATAKQILEQINLMLCIVTSIGAYVCWAIAKHLSADSLEHTQFVQIGLALTVLALYILIYG